MQVIVEKPPIPLLWLDTWCILDMTRALNGSDKEKKERAQLIYDKILSLTQEKKLLCPEGDQYAEIELSNNEKLVDNARKLLLRLSHGISLHFYASVENLQTQIMMKAVIEGSEKVSYSWNDIFHRDPVKELEEQKEWLIDVKLPIREDQVEERLESNRFVAEEWEKLRQKALQSKEKYDHALSREYEGKAETIEHVMQNLFAKAVQRKEISVKDMLQAAELAGKPITWWERYSGKSDAWEDVLGFYRSPEYKLIPSVRISTRLLADLVCGNEKISQSDIMDIHHIATVMPYASYMVVDKRMRNRIEGKPKLDEEYPTVILRWEELLPLLEKL